MKNSRKVHRKLNTMEKYFWLIDRVSRSNILIHAEFRGEMDQRTLRRALDLIQARHPLLQARILRKGWSSAGYIFGDVPPIPLRILAAPPESWTRAAEEELNTLLPLEEGPLIRSTLIRHEKSRATLLLTFHHAIGDGISGGYLVRDLFAAASMISGGKEAELPLLSPGREMETCLPPSARGIRGRWRHMKYALRTVGAVLFKGRPVLPEFDEKAPAEERKAVMTAKSLDSGIVGRLHEKAREQGTTLHSSLLAAQILAIADDRGLREPGLFIVGSPVNLRSRLIPRIREDFGFFVTMGVSVNRARMDTDLWELAGRVRQSLHDCVDRGDPFVYYYHQKYLSLITALTGVGKRAGRVFTKLAGISTLGGLGFSNIGRMPMETVYDPFTIENLGFAASGSGISPLIAFAATIGEQTTWNFVGMEPLLSRTHLEHLAEKAMEILMKAIEG